MKEILQNVFTENKIDAIIHFAGSIVVSESVKNPLEYYENNTTNSRILIEESVNYKVPYFIFSSTAAVYGTPALKNCNVPERFPLEPESPYGNSKLMTEIMLKDAAKAYGFNYTILRYFNVCGADPEGRTGQISKNSTHLIKIACEAALNKREFVSIYGNTYPTKDGTCVRDYIHVSDLVDIHLKALYRLREGKDSLTANCGYGSGYSVLEVLQEVQKVSGSDFTIKLSEKRDGDPAFIVANSNLAKKEFNWQPKYNDLSFMIKTALDWEKTL